MQQGKGTEGGRALVTGGAGFIGSHLVDRLLSGGYEVTCVDNLILGKREYLQSALEHREFRLHEFDLLDLSRLSALFDAERFDIVFHLAANSDIRSGSESTSRDLNLTFLTTYNVLECMRLHGVRKLLFTSTSAIFGDQLRPFEEDTPARPESLYGASKLASEAFISAFTSLYGFQSWICRLSNIVGERTTHGIIHDLLEKLAANPRELEVLGDGTQSKPYMYVHDLVDAILFIIERMQEPLNVINIGPRDGARVSDIARMVLEATGTGQIIAYTGGVRGWKGDVPLFRYNPAKLEGLGWSPACGSADAVRKAISAIVAARR